MSAGLDGDISVVVIAAVAAVAVVAAVAAAAVVLGGAIVVAVSLLLVPASPRLTAGYLLSSRIGCGHSHRQLS